MAILNIEDLCFEAQGNKILDDVSFQVNESEFVAITGPSGSGKSTLLKIISGLISKTSGNVFYNGKEISEYEPTEYRKEVSYCFQSPVLFGTTVKDNLSFPYEIREEEFDKQKAVQFLDDVGLTEDYLDKHINTLSGGEKQRVALIRNVLYQPHILLLDEITSALDAVNREIIWNWLYNLKQKATMTILMVSHSAEDVKLADRVINIVEGRMVK